MKVGIRTRLTLSLFVLMVIALLMTSLVLIKDANERLKSFQKTQAQFQAKTLAEGSLDALISQDFELLERWVESAMPSSEYAYAALVRPNGKVLTHSNLDMIGEIIPTEDKNADGVFVERQFHNRPVLEVVYASVLNNKHLANAHIAYYLDIPYEQKGETTKHLVLIMFVCGVLLLISVYFVTDKIVEPIRKLTNSVSGFTLERGVRFSSAILNRNDEVGALAKNFDELSHRLIDSYQDLKAKSDELEEKVIKRTHVLEDKTNQLEATNHQLYLAQKEIKDHRDNLQDLVEERTAELKVAIDVAVEARKFAEKANNAKSEFISNMSHELRTPMHAILGFASLGLNKLDPEKNEPVVEYLTTIITSGNRLMLFLNNLLDISRMEAGYSELHLQEANLKELTEKSIKTFLVSFDAKKLELQLNTDFKNQATVFDPKMIEQVVVNLIGNAVKFSRNDSVIKISITDDAIDLDAELNAPAVHFKIVNYGIPIPENEMEEIFEKFIQSSATKTGAGGTGLGLSISKSIITAHKGMIWAENMADEGVAFHFIIPVMPSYAEAKSAY